MSGPSEEIRHAAQIVFSKWQNRNQAFRFSSKHAQAFRKKRSYCKRNARIARAGQCDLAPVTRKKQENAPDANVFVECGSARTALFITINKFTRAQRPASAGTIHYRPKREQHSFWCRWTCEKKLFRFQNLKKNFFYAHTENMSCFWLTGPLWGQFGGNLHIFDQSFGQSGRPSNLSFCR